MADKSSVSSLPVSIHNEFPEPVNQYNYEIQRMGG